jgi:DNA-binding transcriptional regulator LsrR (DeoR family)
LTWYKPEIEHRKQIGCFYARYKASKLTKTALAAELKISRPKLNRLVKEYEEQKRAGIVPALFKMCTLISL